MLKLSAARLPLQTHSIFTSIQQTANKNEEWNSWGLQNHVAMETTAGAWSKE